MRQKIRIMVFRIKKGRKRETIPWRPVAVPVVSCQRADELEADALSVYAGVLGSPSIEPTQS